MVDSPVKFSNTIDEFPDCAEIFMTRKTPMKRPYEKFGGKEKEYPCHSKVTKLTSPSKSLKNAKELPNHQEITKIQSVVSLVGCFKETEQFFLLPNNIDVILLVDKQETCGCVN